MWSELDKEELEREEFACIGAWSPDEIEQIVVMVRLNRYNRGISCGAAALHQVLKEHYSLRPLPSVRKIGEILTRHGLTNRRTGWYEGEEQESEPVAIRTDRLASQKRG